MRVRFGDTDVGAIVGQMDTVVAQLRSAWAQADSQWTLMFTQDQADAVTMRLASLRGLIDDLDVGGVGRVHVFFPLMGRPQMSPGRPGKRPQSTCDRASFSSGRS
jgi:hypothetical protein